MAVLGLVVRQEVCVIMSQHPSSWVLLSESVTHGAHVRFPEEKSAASPLVQAKVSGTVAVMVTSGAAETGQVGIDS